MIKSVYYISPRDMRKNRSDAVHIMMCCYALTTHNVDVTLVTPSVKRKNNFVKFSEIFSLYGLSPKFSITELPTKINENRPGLLNFWSIVIQKVIHFMNFYWRNRKVFNNKDTIIYSQCYISSIPYLILKNIGLVKSNFVFTAASIKQSSIIHKYVFRNSDLIIAGLKYTVSDIIKYTGISKSKFIDTPLIFLSNCVNRKEEFDKYECRAELGFEKNKKYILYAGKTGTDVKSVNYFIRCAESLPEYNFIVVGANELTLNEYNRIIKKNGISNLFIISFLPLPEYFKYVQAADLLIDYYHASYYNKYYLGPGKSSYYFSSKNPVIFSDLPSLRHLFPEEIVYFVEPDNLEMLISRVKEIIQDEVQMKLKAQLAYSFARKHSFEYTMGKILKFCQIKLSGIN